MATHAGQRARPPSASSPLQARSRNPKPPLAHQTKASGRTAPAGQRELVKVVVGGDGLAQRGKVLLLDQQLVHSLVHRLHGQVQGVRGGGGLVGWAEFVCRTPRPVAGPQSSPMLICPAAPIPVALHACGLHCTGIHPATKHPPHTPSRSSLSADDTPLPPPPAGCSSALTAGSP